MTHRATGSSLTLQLGSSLWTMTYLGENIAADGGVTLFGSAIDDSGVERLVIVTALEERSDGVFEVADLTEEEWSSAMMWANNNLAIDVNESRSFTVNGEPHLFDLNGMLTYRDQDFAVFNPDTTGLDDDEFPPDVICRVTIEHGRLQYVELDDEELAYIVSGIYQGLQQAKELVEKDEIGVFPIQLAPIRKIAIGEA